MKKIIAIFFLIASFLFSCEKKASTSTSTTSTSSVSSPSVNTSVAIGGPGWSFDGCATAPNRFRAYNGSAMATLDFGAGTMAQGVYSLTSGIPSAGQVRLSIVDPPGQPTGYTWYSSSLQSISVFTAASNATVAIFNNISCAQISTVTPVVIASGTMACF